MLICITFLIGGCTTSPDETSDDNPRIYRVGFLAGSNAFNIAMDGFQAGMTDLGYIEGENISYDLQYPNGNREKMKTIAEQFVADGVDLILTTTTGAAQEARIATENSQTSVVFTVVSDPIGSNVVADLRQPGGNATGVTRSLAGLMSKRVAFLHEIMPDFQGIWVPYEVGYINAPITLKAVHEVTDPVGIDVIESPITSPQDVLAEIERFSALGTLGFNAIKISPDPTIQSEESMAAITAFAREHNLPIVANAPDQVRKGALVTYSDDTSESGYLAASLADKIFKGTNPGVIPLIFSEPNLYINYKTAQMLGLVIDESLLVQAAEIIR